MMKNLADDIVVKEVHLPVNKPVLLKFRSRDVIHSAFLPHFRVQMNCVPGLSTQFAFTPTKTTAEMKAQEGEDFEYIMLCNKICGSVLLPFFRAMTRRRFTMCRLVIRWQHVSKYPTQI